MVTAVASDGNLSTPVTFSVPIKAPNRAPVGGTPSVGTPNASIGTVTGALNFTDADGDSLTYNVSTQPSAGAVTVTSDGAYTFTPNKPARDAAATGGPTTTTVTVTANDGLATGSVSFAVPISPTPPTPPVNHTPTATPTQQIADQATGVVLGNINGADSDGNSLSYSVTGAPTTGSVVLNASTGTFTYTPTQAARLAAGTTPGADFDTFNVSVSDGQATTPVTVSVALSPAVFTTPVSTRVGASPMGAVVSATKAYVANQGNSTVSVIDRANPSATPVTINVVSSPRVVALSKDGSRLFVGGVNAVTVINTSTNSVVGSVATSGGQINGLAVSAAGANGQYKLYASNQNTNTISVITATPSTNTYGVSSTMQVGQFLPAGLALSPDGTKLYVANYSSSSVRVMNTATGQPIGNPIAVGALPYGLAISPDGSKVYTANSGSNTVSVINTTTNQVSSIAVGSNPFGIAISPDGSVLYAPNANDTVSVINTKTNAIIKTVSIDTAPENQWHNIAVSPDGRQLYVSDMADGQLRTLTISRGNTAPVASTPTVGAADANTGAVSGALNFTDPDGDPLSYSVSQPSTGTVAVAANGTYTFTPSQAARDAAATPQGAHSASFTVTASDGQAATPVTVTAHIAPAAGSSGLVNIGGVTITGQRPGALLLTADGTRALLVTSYPIGPVTIDSYPDGTGGSTTRIAIIDTTSGSQVGTTFSFTGPLRYGPGLSVDGTRAYVVSTAAGTNTLTEINTTTGTQIGAVTLTGGASASLVLSPDKTRALFTTTASSPATSTTLTRVAVINTATGAQIGSTLTLNGASPGPSFSPDGTRVVISSGGSVAVINPATGAEISTKLTGSWVLQQWVGEGGRALISSKVADSAGTTTLLALLDTTTGAQIGTTLAVTDDSSAPYTPDVQYTPDGTRALITNKATSSAGTTRLAVFDTITGTQIGTTLAVPGNGSVESGPDGSRVLITNDDYDSATALHTTRVTLFNTTTGTQTGSLSLTGSPYNRDPVFSPDGTRALIATTVYDATTTLHTSRVTMFNTTTGAQLGTTLTLTGPEVAGTTWSADASRALITMTPTQYDTVASPMLVAVIDASGNQIGTTITLAGMPTYGAQPVWSRDGRTVTITTKTFDSATGTTTRVTTLNTTTGTAVTTTASSSSQTVLSPNGSRAFVITDNQVAVMNTATNGQIGTTIALDGTPGSPLFSADGTRAIFSTATSATVIDTVTGLKVGTTAIPTLVPTSTGPRSILTLLTADGNHVLFTTDYRHFAYAGISATPVALIDLTNGTGTTFTLIGDTFASPAFTLGGTRILISTGVDDSSGGSTTRVTTINTATGMPIGSTVTLTGALSSGAYNPIQVLPNPDGSRALLATTSTPDYHTSQVTLINTATGTQIGNPVTINGAISGLKWSADGTRVFVTTYITTATGADMSIQETVLESF